MATGNEGIGRPVLSLVDFCKQVRAAENINPNDNLCLSNGRIVTRTEFDEAAVKQVGMIEYMKYLGGVNITLKDGNDCTFWEGQQALADSIQELNKAARLGERRVTQHEIKGLTPATLKPLVRQYESSPFQPFYPGVMVYPDVSDNEPVNSAPPLLEGDYKKLMDYLKPVMGSMYPQCFATEAAKRDLFHHLCSVDQAGTIRLAQLVAGPYRDLKDEASLYQKLIQAVSSKKGFPTLEQTMPVPAEEPIPDIGNMTTTVQVGDRPVTYFSQGMPLPKGIKNPNNLQALDYELELDPTEVKKSVEANNRTARQAAFAEGQTPSNEKYTAFETLLNSKDHPSCLYGDSAEMTSRELPDTGIAMTEGNCLYEMQDVYLAGRRYCEIAGLWVPVTFIGVLDGHCQAKTPDNPGGDDNSAATKSAQNLPRAVTDRLELFNNTALTQAGLVGAVQTGVVDLDRHQLYNQGGSTLNTAVVLGNTLTIANVGDSRALYVNPHALIASPIKPDQQKEGPHCFIQLSEDAELLPENQKPDNADSRFNKMLRERGGKPEPDRKKPGLLRARFSEDVAGIGTPCALGDHNHHGAISPRPVITQYSLEQFDNRGYLIQFCDGISEVATSEQVARLVRQEVLNNPDVTPEQLAILVRDYAYKANSKDHLTVVVTPVSSLKQP